MANVVVVVGVESAWAADGANAISPKMPTLASSPASTAYRLLNLRRIPVAVAIYLSKNRQTKRPTQTMSTKCQ